MSGNIADYYDNARPTKFNESTPSSIDNIDLSLNAIYEYLQFRYANSLDKSMYTRFWERVLYGNKSNVMA